MRPILYPPGTTDFTNLGVGKLRDTISAEVYEARNGAFTLEVEYPVNGVYFDQIKEFSYIKAKPNDRDDYHTFMVYEVTKSTTSRSVIVLATTKTDEIGNTLVTMTDTGNPQSLLNAMKTKALDPISYNMYSDISASKKVDWLRRNPLNAIVGEAGSLVDLFGGELKRTDSTIFLYQRRGNDKVAKFTARRGLKGAKIVLSTASIVTRILPYITILGGAEEEDVTLTGTIVNSPLVNNYPVRPLVPVDFGMIDDSIDTLAKLNAKAATYFTSLYPEIDKPKVSVDLDLLSLQDTSDYAQFKAVEKIELCDTIDVYLPKYDVVRTVKVTELYYDSLREINTRIVAGDKAVSQIDAFKKEYNGQVNSIKDHLSKVENTMMVKGDGTQIWSGPDTPPPDKVNINDIWWKKTGEDTWALLIWNGLIWEDMLSDEIFKEIDIRIDQAETDIAQNVLDIESTLAKATQAEQDAGFSKDLAEEAKALGVTASSLAGEAKTNANTAMADALEAIRQVELNEGVVADSSADSAEARRLAGLAEANAQEAKINAGTAIADAEEALRQVVLNGGVAADANAEAVEARRLAGLAEGNAQEALTKANTAVTDSSTALTNATKAFNKSIKSTAIAYTTSTNGSTPPTTGWGTTVPSPSPDVYIWTRTTIVLNDNTPVVSYSVGKIGAKGDQGLKGDTGGQGIQGIPGVNAPTIKSVVQQFYLSTSNSTQTGGSWLATVPVWSSGKYYWRRVVTTYSNNTTSTSTPVLDNALNDSLITALEVKTANQTLSTTVTQHATLIESKANSSTVDSLTGRVSTAEGSISTIAGEVALKANSSDVDTLTGRVTTAEGTITAQAGQIALRATTATVNTLTGRVSTAEGKITTQAGLIELKADTTTVNTLTGRVSAAESSLSVQAGQIASKVSQTDFNALDGRVGTAESTITQQAGEIALRVTTTTYNAGIGSKENNITKATTAPAHLSGRLWLDTSVTPNVLKRSTGTAWVKVTPTTPGEVGAYSAGDGSALAGRVTTAETSITANTTAINLRATKTDLDATKGRLTTAEGAITVQAGQIALKASQTSVDTLTGRVGTAETNISANTTAINLRATKTSVDTLTGRVTTAEGSITAQAGQIALKANTTTVNALTGRVSAAESALTVQSGKIDLAATKTELTTAIDGIQVGGRNLIRNSQESFKVGYSGIGEHNKQYNVGTDLTTPLTIDNEYTISLRARGNIKIMLYRISSTGNSSIPFIGKSSLSETEFRYFSITFRPHRDELTAIYLTTGYNTGVSGWYEIDENSLKLEKGNKATDWTPAPEDVDKAISTVQANLTVEAGKITALTTRVSGSETNITNVTQTVSGINTTISTLRTDVNGKATIVSLNEVKSTADGNKTTISNHSGRLTTVETNVNGLQTTVSDKADKTTVTQLATSVELKATKTDVDALTGRVSTAEGKITTQAGQIDLKANTTTVNTLTGRVATAEGNITTQAGLIALKANQSVVDTLTGRVSTTESKITATDGKVTTLTTKTDGHTTSIGLLETSYSGLSSTVTALETGKVGTVEFSALEQNLSGFKTTVQNTYATKTTVTQLATQWATTTDLANGHTSQIASLGTDINLRATKTEVAESILADKKIKDTRTTNQLPPWYYTNYPKQKAYEFKQCTTIGLPTSAGTYASVVTEVPWDGVSGGTIEQTATATDGVYQRRGTTTWSAWAKVADSSNIISQINISPESILIASKKIQIKGDTYIDNGVIKTAHIADLAVSGAKIANATIASAKIISLDASKITTGTLNAGLVSVGANSGSKQIMINGDGLTARDDTGKLRMSIGIRDLAGIGQSDPSNIVFYSGNGKNSMYIGTNVNDTFVIAGASGTMRSLFNMGPSLIISTNQLRLTDPRGTSDFLEIRRTLDGTDEMIVFPSKPFSGQLGSAAENKWFRILRASEIIGHTLNVGYGVGAPHLGDLSVGVDSGTPPVGSTHAFVRSKAIYNRTYGSQPTACITDFGTLGRIVSARKYKEQITNCFSAIANARKVLEISPSEWYIKGRLDKREYGFIADDFHELGLHEVVQYGTDGQVEGLAYDRISMYHNVILKDHEQQLKRLDGIDSNIIKLIANTSNYGLRLNNLEAEVFRLKKRIEELEKIA